MARKNGCPFSVRDWIIEIRSRASTNASPVWIRLKGGTSMELSIGGDTEDGSAADALWAEPYITKRNGSLTLECKRIVDSVTGAADPGQAELAYFGSLGGCDGDARIKLVDAVGNSQLVDVVVTSAGNSADDTSETVSYDMEIIGEPIRETYVQASAVAVKDGSTAITTLSAVVNVPKELTVAFTPATASNQKYAAYSADPSHVAVAIDGLDLTVTGLIVSATPVNVTVRSMNNSLTATVAVTVTAT